MAVNGTLKVLVLKMLSYKESNGSHIVKNIQEKTGWKVSPGSFYPLMKELTELGFIKTIKNSSSNNYKITKKGLNLLKNAEEKKKEIKKKIEESFGLLEILGEEDEIKKLKKFREKSYEIIPSKETIEKMDKVVNQIDTEKNKEKIKQIFSETIDKLERLK